ncbi:hypothetical protein PCANC_05684 [Puccinia coronata f. sp. avenae]|uniref:Uncharacterized protein n=1 Tax=Puccinia coronata f. sp. avenae TaxID=200324 RepID=A0A2N5VXY4_9BASI|nr:hypothetical protein PCANC_05684 [Puccinia coronata f. sp. avenae]
MPPLGKTTTSCRNFLIRSPPNLEKEKETKNKIIDPTLRYSSEHGNLGDGDIMVQAQS